MRILGWIAAVAVAFVALAGEALAERRVALVVGNSDYRHAPRLPNPANDAEAMAGLLSGSGFEVITAVNLGRDGFTERLTAFATAARGADVALFFYAGHGMQVDGKNFLVPVDSELKSELDVKLKAFDVDVMLQQVLAEAKVKLVLLDACRDNPFAAEVSRSVGRTRNVTISSGLAEMRSGEGTLIAFATAPGQVAQDGNGTNSPFTSALLKHLATPGLEIRHALTLVRRDVHEATRLQQLPWENTSLTGLFYFRPAAEVQAAPVVASLAPTGLEIGRAPASTTPVHGGAAPAAAAPAGAELEMEFWRSVRDSNRPDEMRAYLERYPNGTFAGLAQSRIAALSAPPPAAPPPAAPGPVAVASTAPGPESGSSFGGLADPGANRSTPSEPEGPKVDPLARTAEASRATEDAIGLDKKGRSSVQKKLTALGFSTRGTSGAFGKGTRTAVQNWQSSRGYPSTGYLNTYQLAALESEALPEIEEAPSAPTVVRRVAVPTTPVVVVPARPRKVVVRPVTVVRGGGGGGGDAAAAAIVGGFIGGLAAGRAARGGGFGKCRGPICF